MTNNLAAPIRRALAVGRAEAIARVIGEAGEPPTHTLDLEVALAKESFDSALMVLDAITQKLVDIEYGGRRLHEDGWRDEEGHEWCIWLGKMVECPSCGFMFGADHYDKTESGEHEYTCPNCKQDEIETAIRAKLGAVIFTHGVGEMSELLAELLALVTGGASVGR